MRPGKANSICSETLTAATAHGELNKSPARQPTDMAIRDSTTVDMANADRFEDALAFACAALRDFETYGDRAADMITKTRQLIAEIEKGLEASNKKDDS